MIKRLVLPVCVVAVLLGAVAIAVGASGSRDDAPLAVTVREEGASSCVEAIDPGTDGRPGFCAPPGAPGALHAGVVVDCPTARTVILGVTAKPLRAVTVEGRDGEREGALAEGARTGFAVVVPVDDFPARLLVAPAEGPDRVLDLPDVPAACADAPTLTTTLEVEVPRR